MVAYSFKKQFRATILAGEKRQTIRAERKRHARPGEALQLYTGMRTKHCELIGLATCAVVRPIRLYFGAGEVEFDHGAEAISRRSDLDVFACADGFEGWDHLRWFWEREHPNTPLFSGVLIGWAETFVPANEIVRDDAGQRLVA